MTEIDEEPERELAKLQDQADTLGDHISHARDDWESKKRDPAVPGAGGDPEAAHSDHPEDQYPAKGDSGELGEDLEASERLDTDDPQNEDL